MRATLWIVAGLAAVGLAAPAADAQTSGRGFLFREPNGSFAVRGGYSRAMAGSDVFSFSTEQLTLSKSDFAGVTFGADLSIGLGDRTDLVLGADYAASKASSELRDWVDQDDQPIEQSTNFKRVPVTASVKYYLTDRGRSISNFAWIPSRYSPYVGAGAGGIWYRFRQEGDFVDFETLDVISGESSSSGWAPVVHGMAGIDYSLGPWFAMTGEARYSWARAAMDASDFEGFDKIDLSGLSGTIGFKFRF